MSHTHWDREWYYSAERFRQDLVALIDELLEDPTRESPFLLDGQTVVLEDYLDVRPERASDVSNALRESRLAAGPWFVLADELIPGGEGLVRNLLAGRRTLRSLRTDSPPVLYCPDSFGHPAALPLLAAEFGKTLVVVWRGHSGSKDAFWWRACDGRQVLTYHLSRSGYELGANLPTDPARAGERWSRIHEQLAARCTTGTALLLNGADHHAPQREVGAALEALRAAAHADEVRASSIAGFARDIEQRSASSRLEVVSGELRDSYGYTWTLQGTLGSRAAQKRNYALRERELLRDVEPWVALATLRGARSARHLVNAAWRSLLLCQPHDTLCGCSSDDVARAMNQRLRETASQGSGLRAQALSALLSHDAERARQSTDAWKPVLLVRNPAARARGGVAQVEISVKLADAPVGLGSNAPGAKALDAAFKSALREADAARAMHQGVQVLETRLAYERTEAPRAYPDNDAVARSSALVWVDPLPAYGVVPRRLHGSPQAVPRQADCVVVKGREMSNARVLLTWDARGRVALVDRTLKRTVANLVSWESRLDLGDLYTPSIRGPHSKPRLAGTRLVHRGPLRAVLEQTWRFAKGKLGVDARVSFVLDAGAPFVRVSVSGTNSASDHRLRMVLSTDVSGKTIVADAAFGLVERRAPRVSPAAAKMERPVPTAPLHRYVSLFDAKRGATIYSDGLAEYEHVRGGVAITLLRAVGELSRSDLPERPGHAGWPVPTPEAQSHGPFDAAFAVMLHGPRSDAVIDEIERTADDVLHPLTGATLRSALAIPLPVEGFALDGAGLAFTTAKEAEEGEWLVLRCVNLTDADVRGAWRLPRDVREARLSRLDESPLAALTPQGSTISFRALPRGVVTILVR